MMAPRIVTVGKMCYMDIRLTLVAKKLGPFVITNDLSAYSSSKSKYII